MSEMRIVCSIPKFFVEEEFETAINSRTKAVYRIFSSEGLNLWSEKYQRKNDYLSCIICGRDTSKKGESEGVIIGDGGDAIVLPDDDELARTCRGYMGWFPIGSECIKVIPKRFRIKTIYENKTKGV